MRQQECFSEQTHQVLSPFLDEEAPSLKQLKVLLKRLLQASSLLSGFTMLPAKFEKTFEEPKTLKRNKKLAGDVEAFFDFLLYLVNREKYDNRKKKNRGLHHLLEDLNLIKQAELDSLRQAHEPLEPQEASPINTLGKNILHRHIYACNYVRKKGTHGSNKLSEDFYALHPFAELTLLFALSIHYSELVTVLKSVVFEHIKDEEILSLAKSTRDERKRHLSHFAGRAEELATIEQFFDLKNPASYFIISGPHGIGKSGLSAQASAWLCDQAQETWGKSIPWSSNDQLMHHPWLSAHLYHTGKTAAKPADLLRFVHAQARTLLLEPFRPPPAPSTDIRQPPSKDDSHLKQCRRWLKELLLQLAEERGYAFFIVDALDEMQPEVISLFPSELPQNCKVLLTTRGQRNILTKLESELSGLYTGEAFELEGLKKEAIEELLNITASSWIASFLENSSGHPLMIHHALRELRKVDFDHTQVSPQIDLTAVFNQQLKPWMKKERKQILFLLALTQKELMFKPLDLQGYLRSIRPKKKFPLDKIERWLNAPELSEQLLLREDRRKLASSAFAAWVCETQIGARDMDTYLKDLLYWLYTDQLIEPQQRVDFLSSKYIQQTTPFIQKKLHKLAKNKGSMLLYALQTFVLKSAAFNPFLADLLLGDPSYPSTRAITIWMFLYYEDSTDKHEAILKLVEQMYEQAQSENAAEEEDFREFIILIQLYNDIYRNELSSEKLDAVMSLQGGAFVLAGILIRSAISGISFYETMQESNMDPRNFSNLDVELAGLYTIPTLIEYPDLITEPIDIASQIESLNEAGLLPVLIYLSQHTKLATEVNNLSHSLQHNPLLKQLVFVYPHQAIPQLSAPLLSSVHRSAQSLGWMILNMSIARLENKNLSLIDNTLGLCSILEASHLSGKHEMYDRIKALIPFAELDKAAQLYLTRRGHFPDSTLR